MFRTAQVIEERKASPKSDISTEGNGKKQRFARGKHPNSRKGVANLKPIPPGVSGNPGGLPGTDLAALYARRFFEAHPEGIGSMVELKGFNAYAFGVLADRAYGKSKDETPRDAVNMNITVTMVSPNGDSHSD